MPRRPRPVRGASQPPWNPPRRRRRAEGTVHAGRTGPGRPEPTYARLHKASLAGRLLRVGSGLAGDAHAGTTVQHLPRLFLEPV